MNESKLNVELRRRLEELKALNTLGQKVSASLSLHQVVKAALEGVYSCVDQTFAVLHLRQKDTLILQDIYPQNPQFSKDSPEVKHVGECLCGLAISQGKPIYSKNIHTDRRCLFDECKKAGVRSFAALPLRGGQELIGVLGIASIEERDFVQQGDFLETVAHQVAIGLQNALMHDTVQHHAAELEQHIIERKMVETELRKSREELRNLATHLQSVEENERTQVAREIHDELGQALTGLKMDLSWLEKRLYHERASVLDKIHSMTTLVDATIRTVKKISTKLRPGILDDLGLGAAIEWQTGEFQKRTEIDCRISIHPPDVVLDQDTSTALFRIFQETLTNIARHAEATEVRVDLEQKSDIVTFKIRDNGRGITEEEKSAPTSYGLIGMRERVHALHGEIEIDGFSGQGTTITVRFPLDAGEIAR